MPPVPAARPARAVATARAARSSGGAGGSGGKAGAGGTGGAGGKAGAGGTVGSGGATGGAGGKGGSGGTSATGGSTGASGASGMGPCDIFAAANTACVAAHSTVRALLGAYSGPLYKVKRASDSTTKDIGVVSPGGLADTATQDTFCMGTTCTITMVYDQSGHGNVVEAETPDSTVGGHSGMTASNATQEIADPQRSQGLLALHEDQPGLLEGRLEVRDAARQRSARDLHGDQRQALRQRLLLRLRQRRDRPDVRGRPLDGRPQLQQLHDLGNRRRRRAVGHGRSRGRALCEGWRRPEHGRSEHDVRVRHRHGEEQRDGDLRPQGRRRDVRQPEHLLQRLGAAGIQPGQEARVHRSGQRRRLLLQQQHREPGDLLRRSHRRRAIRPTPPTRPSRRTSSWPATESRSSRRPARAVNGRAGRSESTRRRRSGIRASSPAFGWARCRIQAGGCRSTA